MSIQLAHATDPLVLALDVGSSSVRAFCYDAEGRSLAGIEGRISYKLHRQGAGRSGELDAGELATAALACLDQVYGALGPDAGRIAAIGTCAFWHSLVGLDRAGRPATPLFPWTDTRSCAVIPELRRRLDPERYRARTGCVLHPSYAAAMLFWLGRTLPAFGGVARWVSFGELLFQRLTGELQAAVSMASATGLFDVRTLRWDRETLEALGVRIDALPGIVDLSDGPFRLGVEAAARWPAWRACRCLPVIGDGIAANVGSGCLDRSRIALSVGTSGALRLAWTGEVPDRLPAGLWCYRLDRSRVVAGGAISNAGLVVAWLRQLFGGLEAPALEAVAGRPPDGHGLTVLPFLIGERTPEWPLQATGAIAGLRVQTSMADIVQAALESVAYRFALIEDRLEPLLDRDPGEEGAESPRIIATGGALRLFPAWGRMLSDAVAVPIFRPASEEDDEASARGTGLLALEVLGVGPPSRFPIPLSEPIVPDPERRAQYRTAIDRHQRLYDALAGGGWIEH